MILSAYNMLLWLKMT